MSGAAPAITAATRVAAVLGAPVAHSRSPDMHNAAFAALGIDAVFVAFHVEPADLAAAVSGLRALGALGASVTVPHKAAAAALCDRLAPPADAIGAVNCLVFEPGAVIGHNTDAGGFVDALRHEAGRDPAGARAVLLGAGGAARAVHAGLASAGARVDVVARDPARVSWTAAHPWTADALARLCAACDLLVDCTSAGLAADAEGAHAAIPLDRLPAGALVTSLVYHRMPALLRRAAARDLAVLDGAGMLIHQGIRAFELWTGRRPSAAVLRGALRGAGAGPGGGQTGPPTAR